MKTGLGVNLTHSLIDSKLSTTTETVIIITKKSKLSKQLMEKIVPVVFCETSFIQIYET